MALTGHLSDLSLSELIEFFCNQRKTGRLTVLYARAPGYFYLQAGSVVDARIGVLRGIDAVYYALTLPNAKFEFGGSDEPTERTINQPWTQVVLEGLRRLDEGLTPADAFPAGYEPETSAWETEASAPKAKPNVHESGGPAFLSFMDKGSVGKRKPMIFGAVAVAVLGSVAAIGVPAGWYNRAKVGVAATSQPVNPPTVVPEPAPPSVVESPSPAEPDPAVQAADAAALAAKRQRERARAREERSAALNQPSRLVPANVPADAGKGPKKITVTVSYDESGRVTQASGGDGNALRIARQKRFPPGKAGSATITIPVN
jgi:Domain of unknown function (DUF4388)